MELGTWLESRDKQEIEAMALWHTHPGGNIGPSPGDMQKRLEGVAYLVVAITEAGPVPTWF
jgi:proteasome lid subunit RPN8/RPN11